jgi:hypothetical protein
MKPIEIVKKGLTRLQNQVQDRKTRLGAELRAGRPISDSDEEWLDNDGNLVDEERVVDALDHASDYEQELSRLNSHDKSILDKLQSLGNCAQSQSAPSKKRKRMTFLNAMIYSMLSLFAGPELPAVGGNARNDPQKVKQKPAFTRKENATLGQRIEILDWHYANGANQSKTAKHFDAIYPNLQLKQPRVSAWCKNEGKWRQEYEIGTSSGHSAKRICQTQHPEVTEMLDLWISKAMADKIILTGEVIRQKWRRFANLAGVPEDERLSLSEGWLTRYKTRNGLKNIKRHGEAASAASKIVEKEQQRIQTLIKDHGYQLRDIFNTDESGLCYA